MQAGIDELLHALPPLLRVPAILAASLLLGWIITRLFMILVVWNLRRWKTPVTELIRQHLRGPVSYLGPVLLANMVWSTDLIPEDTPAIWDKVLAILVIILLSWFLLRVIDLASAIIMRQFDIQEEDNLDERKIITQLQYIRQVAAVVLVILALALILLQFDGVRQVGTGILTSAGVAGIIIGFAAQRSIANLLAGFQIAFTQPIRIDDVVIVEGEWGRIEEITLTYVVIKIWDQRRLVVPLQYFIDKPFQNWTRSTAELTGAVFLYVDYTFPVDSLRSELKSYLEQHPLWDQRVMAVQVTDAKPDVMEVRLLVSAGNAGNTFDLRCDVREHMIAFAQQHYPKALPRQRWEFSSEKNGKAPPAEGPD